MEVPPLPGGYDDLVQLQNMSSEELDETMQDAGLNSKPGHQTRFVAAIQMLLARSLIMEYQIVTCEICRPQQTPLNM